MRNIEIAGRKMAEEADEKVARLIADMLEAIDLRDLSSASDANLEQLAIITWCIQGRIARVKGPNFVNAAVKRWGSRLLERPRPRRPLN
jgi:hypothetical protein